METIPALALIPEGRPSLDLGPAVEMIASWSDPFSQRALVIGVSGCHAILFLGSESGRLSSRIDSLGTDEIRKCSWEEVDLSEYQDFGDPHRQRGRFLDDVYNRKCIHSSLGDLTPSEFEPQWLKGQAIVAV
jgi:hypothetical protein